MSERLERQVEDVLLLLADRTAERDEARTRLHEHEEDNMRLQTEWTRAAHERDTARRLLAEAIIRSDYQRADIRWQDPTSSSAMKRIRVDFVCAPDDGESIVLEVDGLRTHPFGRHYDSLKRLRDEALTKLASIGVIASPIEHFTIEVIARSVVDQSNTSAACIRVDVPHEAAQPE